MNKTENDLSCNEAKLDYQAMLATSKIAYTHCIEQIGRHLNDMSLPNPRLLPYLSAQWLLREAEHLVIATETMYTLKEGLTREVITIVNKPGSDTC